jgi:serine/threonine protein kinase
MPSSASVPLKLCDAIEREIDTLQRTLHEHVCKLYDVVEAHGFTCLVLEHCSGGNVHTIIVHRPLPRLANVHWIFEQIVIAVAYLHGLEISHGDIKPDNIVFNALSNVKLIDFGYCKDRIGLEFNTSGTLHYATPEVLELGEYDTQLADAWALGILLFVMVTGRWPYGTEDSRAIRNHILDSQLEQLLVADKDCATMLLEMTMYDIDDRPTIAEFLAMPWFTVKHWFPRNIREEEVLKRGVK